MTHGKGSTRLAGGAERGERVSSASETLGARIEKLLDLDDTPYPVVSVAKSSLQPSSQQFATVAPLPQRQLAANKTGQGAGFGRDAPSWVRSGANPHAGTAELLTLASPVSTPMIARLGHRGQAQYSRHGSRKKVFSSPERLNRGVRIQTPLVGELAVNGSSTHFFPHMNRSSRAQSEARSLNNSIDQAQPPDLNQSAASA
jgi:hypothetical protein